MQTQLDLLSNSVESLELTVRDLDEAIRGNGSPGIHTRIALHSQRIKRCEEMMTEISGLRRWLFLGVLSLLGSIAWQAIQYFVQQPNTPT
tara:strand:+ start:615 stop:884 length:270 start_codon:yes stop_codon:yes gene_type:complete